MDHSSEKRIPLPLSYLTDRSSIMSASQNKKKTLSLGLALIPVISMLLLLIIGYGIMGLRICLVPRRHHAGTEHQTGTGRFH